MAALVAVLLLVAAPATAASDEAPAATTTTLTATPRIAGQPVVLTARVHDGTDPVGGGTVEFRAGATVLGRAHVATVGSATLGVVLPAGPHVLTATFLGTPEAAGSEGTLAVMVREPTGQSLVVEEVATPFGAGTAEAGGTARVLSSVGSPDVVIDDPDTGELRLEREVPGVGTVGLALRPRFPVRNTGFGWDGIVAVLGLDDSLAVPEPRFGLRVHRITVAGDPWGASCPVVFSDIDVSGRLTDRGYELDYDARPTPVRPAVGCDVVQAFLVDQVLGGRVSLGLLVPGDFPSLLGPEDATRTVVSASTTSATTFDRITVDATVTYGEAPDEHPAPGTVRLLRDGVEIAAATLSSTGEASFPVTLTSAGPTSFTVAYDGPAAPSSDTVVVDVAPFPTGGVVFGSIVLGATASPLPAGAVWVGGAYDAGTGQIGPGSLVSPVGPVEVPFFGGTAEVRLVQLGDATGQVLPDGTAELGPFLLAVELHEVPIIGVLDGCVSHPFEVVLRGTANASGLHVAQADIPYDGFPREGCGGVASIVESFGLPLGLSLSITGDFTPPPG